MNRRTLLIMLAAMTAGGLKAQQWPAVSNEMKPSTRWWWFGSAVDKQGLKYNIDRLAAAGIGGVEVTPIYGVQGNDANEIAYLSPKWMEMFRYTMLEGDSTGVRIDLNNGTGWPFGGPSVSVEDAATKAIFQTYDVEGGRSVSLDISLKDPKQRGMARLSRVMAYCGHKVLNLTARAEGGHLSWNAPEGDWKIIVLYDGKTRQMVKRAAPGGEGYVMDHLSARAVKNYLSTFDKAFSESGTPYPNTFFNDSYEVYQADWTPGLLDIFARKRGYRLENYFPQFLDDKRSDITRRVVADYRETVSDLLLENFTRMWTVWAHRHGSITRSQAHGSPANLIDVYAAVDVPECEGFGLSQFNIKGLRRDSLTRKNDSDLSMLKYASSASHISGKILSSSETFTWLTEHFRTSLSQCKPDLDLFFVAGINHVFFHGTPYSPQTAAWPGWQFYASVNMSPTNSIWRDAPFFFNYITRCQSFLQAGRPDNDFLIYLPVYDMWDEVPGRLMMFSIHNMPKLAPKFIDAVHRITGSGYDGDYISDSFLRKTQLRGSYIETPGGAQYKALIVPGARLMPDDVMKHLLSLVRQGATVVFLEAYPEDVPGLGNLAARRKSFKKAARTLPAADFKDTKVYSYGRGRVITGSDYQKTLSGCGIAHEEMKTKYGLQFLRRTDAGGHHYFISSLQAKGIDGWVTLAVRDEEACLFDPMTGSFGMAATRRTEDGRTQVYMQLRSGESVILQTFKHKLTDTKVKPWPYEEERPLSLQLDRGWTLGFKSSEPEIRDTAYIDEARPWTETDLPGAKVNMGTGVYSIDVAVPQIEADDWVLDLGDVRESARVYVNGEFAGCAWAVPFRVNVGKFLKKGSNHIDVEVTNLPANRIAELDREGVNWRIFKEINMVNLNYKKSDYAGWQTVPSGLNGSVRLIPVMRKRPE